MKKVLVVLALVLGTNAMAYEVASVKPAKKASKADYIRDNSMKCGLAEMDAYERVKGRLPTDDEMDAIMDACVNPTFKKES
ncbi:MAG: hypothetical protein AABZ31_02695 [Bdellovibrionota bacterium]|mgnify:CR=1 FL=1